LLAEEEYEGNWKMAADFFNLWEVKLTSFPVLLWFVWTDASFIFREQNSRIYYNKTEEKRCVQFCPYSHS